MTSRYSEINQHDALYIGARKYPGGVEALAQRLGISPNVLRNKLRPAIDTHHANFEEVSAIIECLEEAHVPEAYLALQAFNWRHGHVAVRLPSSEVAGGELFAKVLRIMDTEGRLANEISQALVGDNRIDNTELNRIESQLQQSIEALAGLREKVRAKHAADCKQR